MTHTNEELLEIIANDHTDKRNDAAEQLLKQSPTNEDLRYIIRWTDKRNEAAELLLKQLGINKTTLPDEDVLITEIARNVVQRPSSLNMGAWHCGTSHSLAGWATVVSEIAANIEAKTDTQTAGYVVLPNYAHLFFSDDDTVLNVLKTKI